MIEKYIKKSKLIKYCPSLLQVLQVVAQACSQDLSFGFWAWGRGKKTQQTRARSWERGCGLTETKTFQFQWGFYLKSLFLQFQGNKKLAHGYSTLIRTKGEVSLLPLLSA